MKFIYLLGVCILFCSCNLLKKEKKKKIVTIVKDDTIIRGDITNDSIFNDTILFYTLSGDQLFMRRFYKDGKQDGEEIRYYPNGHISSRTSYTNGLQNGYSFNFDSSGRKVYSGFYYHDLPVGPIMYYDKDELPKRYYFIDLENVTLMHILYKDWKGLDDIVRNSIYFTCHTQKADSTEQLSLLLYLINPPHISFEYSIVKNRKPGSGCEPYKKINSKEPFIMLTLPMLPDDEKYSVQLDVYDSIYNKGLVIYKEIYVSEW